MFPSKRSLAAFLRDSYLPIIVFLTVFLLLALVGNGETRPPNPGFVTLPSPLLPQAVASFGAAVSDSWLYVYGGHVGKTHQHSSENASSSFYRLNLLDRATWEQLPGSIGLQSSSLVSHGGKIYRIGGMTALNKSGEAEDLHSVADVLRFDPMTRKWEPLPSLPEARSSHDAAILRDRIYVVGGWRLEGKEKVWHSTAHSLDLSAPDPRWEALPAPPFKRRALAVAAVGERLYVLGGMDEKAGISQQVDILDLRKQLWTKGPDLPGNGFGLAAVTLGEQLFVSGMDGEVLRLAAGGQRWEKVSTLAFPRYFHRLVPDGAGSLLAVGGASQSGHLSNIEWIPTTEDEKMPRITSWTIPFSGDAKNRQGVFLDGNVLIVFGGNNSLEQHDFGPNNFLNQAFKIHLGTLAVSPGAEFPVKRQSMQTVVVEGKARYGLAVGGFGHDGEKARAQSEVFKYDLKKDSWERPLVSLPKPRTQFGIVEKSGTFWIFGGLDFDPTRKENSFDHLTSVLTWDSHEPGRGFRASSLRLPRPRRAFGGALLNNRYFLVGGLRENFQLVEECDVFNFETGMWETIPAPKRPRISAELVALNGKLYLAGGSSPRGGGFEPNATVEVYDPGKGEWSTLIERLPVSPRHIRMFPLRDRLLIYSARSEGAKAVHLALIDPMLSHSDREPQTTSGKAVSSLPSQKK
ncbi:MAG: hypothetical protein L0387_12940 [Acidobacteria bacterium]|nr:hypothetical protein [Acidobacteriota bacterium]MCI0724332.1 hypothetical protein [Acidobacteriota bacterium]